jgi:hypothetical protein
MKLTHGMQGGGAVPGGRGISGRGCGTLFFGAFFAIGCLFVVIILGEAIRGLAPWWWAEAPCTITSSRVVETGNDERPYRAAITYSYRVEGRELEGDRVTANDPGTRSYDRARDRVERHPAGSTAICRFDPQRPADSVLERSLPWIVLVVFFPMIFVAVGAAGLYAVWRPAAEPAADGVTSISQKAPRVSGHTVGLVVGAVFMLVGGGLFAWLFAVPAVRSAQTMSWVAARCTIVASELRSWSTDDGTSYRADVLFEYEAGGRAWRSNRIDYFPLNSSGYDGSQAVLERYPAGTAATCWVDPDDPSRAVLDRTLRPVHFLGMLPLLFLVAGAALAAHSRRAAAAVPTSARSGTAVEPGPVELRPQVGPVGKVVGSLLFALLWNGIVSVFVWQAWKSWQRGDPDWFLTVFLIPFVLVGLAAFVFVGHFTLALANPRPRLTLHTAPLCLGDDLRIDWRFQGRAARIRRLQLVLEGREEATYRRGTDTVTDREVFATFTLVDTANEWEIPRGSASLTVPDDTMHSFDAASNKVVWELKVEGDISRWPDVEQTFPVAILPLPISEV